KRAVGIALGVALAVLGTAPGGRAQNTDPYTAEYCEPDPQTKLLYTNRAYLVMPKAPDSPALYFSYKILETGKFVQRRGQLLFDDGDDRWELESNPDALRLFWPLRPEKKLEIERVDRTNGTHAHVSFVVLGLEPIEVNHVPYKSWKIRRLDTLEGGKSFVQFLWYAPQLCTLAAFTDSQHRTVRLLRALKPGDSDYDRELVRKKHNLYFVDTGEMVK
ncbi:MAG TPA: hypothetical protein VN823_20700, partial [Stellaceae bacterium]|nr:hypothetical protein [Stellaceae bacterium]